jgi:hypothetical protein
MFDWPARMKTLIGLAVALSQKPIVTIATIINKSGFFILLFILKLASYLASING